MREYIQTRCWASIGYLLWYTWCEEWKILSNQFSRGQPPQYSGGVKFYKKNPDKPFRKVINSSKNVGSALRVGFCSTRCLESDQSLEICEVLILILWLAESDEQSQLPCFQFGHHALYWISESFNSVPIKWKWLLKVLFTFLRNHTWRSGSRGFDPDPDCDGIREKSCTSTHLSIRSTTSDSMDVFVQCSKQWVYCRASHFVWNWHR